MMIASLPIYHYTGTAPTHLSLALLVVVSRLLCGAAEDTGEVAPLSIPWRELHAGHLTERAYIAAAACFCAHSGKHDNAASGGRTPNGKRVALLCFGVARLPSVCDRWKEAVVDMSGTEE